MEYVGRIVRKEFKGLGTYTGTVRSYDEASGFLGIVYEGGDSEELELREVLSLFEDASGVEHAAARGERPPPRVVGRVPKKWRGTEAERDAEGVLSGNARDDSLSKGRVGGGVCEGLGVGSDSRENAAVNGVLRGEINLNVTMEENLEENLRDVVVCNGYLHSNVVGRGGFDLNSGLDLNQGLNLDEGCDSPVSFGENPVKRSRIDLNLDAPADVDENLRVDDLCSRGKERLIDLNLDIDNEVKDAECDQGGELRDHTPSQLVENNKIDHGRNPPEIFVEIKAANGTPGEVPLDMNELTRARNVSTLRVNACEAASSGPIDVSVTYVFGNRPFGAMDYPSIGDCKSCLPQKDGACEPCDAIHNGSQVKLASPCEQVSRRGRKRKYTQNLNSTVTVLRRSARRVSSKGRDTDVVTLNAANDLASSPAMSAITEEKPEEFILLPPKLQLPPSSQSITLDGISVLDVFSVYSCLRSFSTLLFLSPFELADFVLALKSKSPDALFDCIHVSLLLTLRKHLEHLCNEGSPSALNCLRSLNWDLLDSVTWPLFLVEYLLLHGSRIEGGFDLCWLKLFEVDYYKQPVSLKVEILRCLCDEVMEVELIRSELSRRSSAAEPDVDFDRGWNIENFKKRTATANNKKRKATIDVSGRTCLTGDAADDDNDWNSDECCLCKMDGNLICCDGCPAAYHSRCVGVVNDLLPEGDWYCPECTLERNKVQIKPRRLLRGAELLGIDPHGQLYFSCCDYLLVSDSSNGEASFRYYHKNDINLVAEVLKCSELFYSGILRAIYREWDIPFISREAKANGGASEYIAHSEVLVKGQRPTAPLAVSSLSYSAPYKDTGKADVGKCAEKESLIGGAIVVAETPHVSSEGSIETTLTSSCLHKHWQGCYDGSTELLEKSEVPGNLSREGDCCVLSTLLDDKTDKAKDEVPSLTSLTCISRKCDPSLELGGTGYVNRYSFGQIATFIAEELMRRSSDRVKDPLSTEEDIILAQMKIISKKYNKFYWPDEMSIDAKREKCGWCFFCRSPSDDFNCLFEVYMEPIQDGSETEMAILRSKRNDEGHLVDVIGHILSMEYRLRGLLLGPWLSPCYSQIWRKSAIKALDLAIVKSLLLKLESNIRHLAISEEWFKYEEFPTMLGSASYFVTSSSKSGISRRKGRCSDQESKPSPSSSSGPSLFWWRGGRLSRRLFSWKVLPHSLIHKAARQAGRTRIPGIFYPEGSDLARRSKSVAWRAAVESSISPEQLAIQVRELHLNIRWDDIGNTNPFSKFDRELKKSARAFKKVIVRRKCVEGDAAKYLLDFGKRRVIPDVVLRHGETVVEGCSERKRYWLNESFVPLHLLKSFEEKRIARKDSKLSSCKDSASHSSRNLPDKRIPTKLCEAGNTMKILCKTKGLSYLFSRAEREERECHQCGHCKRDVLIRDAVTCQYCGGFFHKRHVRKSAGAITAEYTYTCHGCHVGRPSKTDMEVKPETDRLNRKEKTVKGKLGRGRLQKTLAKRRHAKLRAGKRAVTVGQSVKSPRGKKVTTGVPLRRSARQAVKNMALQNKSLGRSKKRKRTKSKKTVSKNKKLKKGTSWKKMRTEAYYSYWVNGLLLSRRPCDELVENFREKRFIHPIEKSSVNDDKVACRLCGQPAHASTSDYIACESCEDWYHGDAFGLDAEKLLKLKGFRCHECRKRTPPNCPHELTVNSGESQSAVVQKDAALGCSEEVFNAIPPSDEISFREESHLKENLAASASVPIDGGTLDSSGQETDRR